MEFLLKLLWSIEIIIFAWGIVQLEFCKNKTRIIIGIIIILFAKFFYVYFPNILLGTVVGGIVATMICFIIIFDGKLWAKVIRYFFCFTYAEFFYLPVNTLFVIMSFKVNIDLDSYITDIIKSIIVICVILCLSYFLKKKKELVSWIKEVQGGYFCIAFICALTVTGIDSYTARIMVDASKKARILFEGLSLILSIFIYILGIGFAFAEFLRKKYKNESIMKEKYLDMSKTHYEGLVTHMQEIRKIKHDMQAHINILNKYAYDENLPLLKEYLGNLTEQHMSQNYRMISTGNELVDALITDCSNKNDRRGINIDCDGLLPCDIGITDFDLCTIFSNLLSNAIEACDKLENSEKKVHISLKDLSDEVRIVFENPVEWDVDINGLGTYTSKKDKKNHGFGIDNVRKTVEKYSGNMVMGVEDGKFRTVIIFYK